MAQIIQPGDYPEKNLMECDDCHCKFRYYTSEIMVDVTNMDEQAFLGGIGIHRYVKCPQCNNICTVSTEFIEDDPLIANMKRLARNIFKKGEDKDGKNRNIES